MEVLTMHLPLGLLIGELCGLPLLIGTGTSFNPDKLLKAYQKNLCKAVPNRSDLEALSEDLLETDSQWSASEKGKEDIRYALLGARYWIIFGEGGFVKVIDSDQLDQMHAETVSGQIRSGKVRMNYVHYTINIKYTNPDRKKGWDTAFSFQSEDTAGRFMILARKRLGERASEIIQ